MTVVMSMVLTIGYVSRDGMLIFIFIEAVLLELTAGCIDVTTT